MSAHDWFDNARFGLFIHWGLYSIPARGEWMMFTERVPKERYNKLACEFCPPKDFSPEDWVVLAKEAGARYAVFTTRHHDGFSLYDSKVNPFNSVNTASKRDFVAEYVEACRKHGLKVGLYYSIMNWQHEASHTGPVDDPAGWEIMVEETNRQLEELLVNYGKIDLLWYDGALVPGGGDGAYWWKSAEMNAMVRRLQPEIMINDRSHLPEDFDTPEQEVVAPPAGRRWESCMCMNNNWGYVENDHNYKSVETILRCLVKCARFGGNLLLNIGPRPDGSVPEQSVESLQKIGRWLNRNGEAIYNSERTAYTEANHYVGPTTQVGRSLFFHLFDTLVDKIRIDGVSRADNAIELSSRNELRIENRSGHSIDVAGISEQHLESFPLVVKIELAGSPDDPANMLGGEFELKIEEGDAPVLAVASHGTWTIPEGNILIGEELAALFGDKRTNSVNSSWCPGFKFPVYALDHDNAALCFKNEVSGKYDLLLGVVARRVGNVGIVVDDVDSGETYHMMNPQCPDTIAINDLTLKDGIVTIGLTGDVEVGVYSLRLRPKWTPLPTESWLTIGPFSSDYDPRKEDDAVRVAMERIYGPELEFQPEKHYVDQNGLRLSWSRPGLERGEYDSKGVDFVNRCPGKGKGVCFARAIIESPEDHVAEIAVFIDWWANIFVNEEKIKGPFSEHEMKDSGAEFSSYHAATAKIKLKKGGNAIVVKNHSGRGGSGFAFYINSIC